MSEADDEPKASRWHKRKLWRIGVTLTVGTSLIVGVFLLFAYRTTPSVIRNPSFEHYHFRMQVLVNGKAVNFAEKPYQTDATKDVCATDLTDQPIHFHDNKDQMVHIHWDGMSGGMVLKYYGWNFIGGQHGTLGFRFDNAPRLTNVPIHGNTLPTIPEDERFYVYSGNEKRFREQSWADFLQKDLEDFFGQKSNIPGKELNNLIGNVVVFVQKDKPTSKEIQARFDKLAPLPESSCAG